MSEKENSKKLMEGCEDQTGLFNREIHFNPSEDDIFVREIFDKAAAKIARNIDNAAKKESVQINHIDYMKPSMAEFGTEIDFEDELPEEFPQQLAGVEADELAGIYTDEIMSYLASGNQERQVKLSRRAVAEMQAEKTPSAEDEGYDYLGDVISILKKSADDSIE